MTFEIFRRTVAGLAGALVLGIGAAVVPGVTPSASALPPVSCAQVEQMLSEAEANLRSLRSDLNHLIAGGVTQDEVNYMSATLTALAAAQDDVMFLRAIMYKCLQQRHAGKAPERKLRAIAALQLQVSELQAEARVLLARARAARR